MNNATLFISHSSYDSLVATAFSHFMTSIGISPSHIICSSTAGTHISTGVPLYTELRRILSQDNVLFIMLLSNHYYASPICLNEMGAAWVKGFQSLFFILPGFSFKEVKGVVAENIPTGISFAPIDEMTTERFYDFKQIIEEKFGISIEGRCWERERETFYQKVKDYSNHIYPIVHMDEAEGMCIGLLEHNGCKITKKSPTGISSTISFSLIQSDLCSIIFPTFTHNWTQFADNKKQLHFCAVSSSSKPVNVELELALFRRKRYPITITNQITDYCIPLEVFSKRPSDFSSVQEICFLFYRNNISPNDTPIEINISNIRLI